MNRFWNALRGLAPWLVVAGLLAPVGGQAAPAAGPWVNGQNAAWVVGQAEFDTNVAGTDPAALRGPKDVAVDTVHGKLYIADTHNNRILRYSYPFGTSQPEAEYVFGQVDFTSALSATARTRLHGVHGLAVDAAGRLWVADTENQRVLRFDHAYSLTATLPPADGVLGQTSFETALPAAGQPGMNQPVDLVVDGSGTLFVADSLNNRVLRFDDAASLANGAPASAVLGQATFAGTGAATTQEGMAMPRGLALLGPSLFVAERNNARVTRFDGAAGLGNGAAASGVLGQTSYFTNTPAISQSRFAFPSRLTADNRGRLYVSDGFDANRVLVFENAATLANGAPASAVLGQVNFTDQGAGLAQNRFDMDSTGSGLTVDPIHNFLLVADDNNNRVMVFEAAEELGWVLFLPLARR
jgi:DNA-binding beta-propeller fold protein YncE